MKEIEPKRSAASWLAELAKGRYGEYALSVLTALLGVACSLIPYFIIIRLITALVNSTAELTYCLTLCAWMAGCWVLRYVLHSVSTSLSHHATFHVLANTRTRLLDKLATLPLGTVLDHSSGSYKNIIVERVDSIETTLAHLLPEMTTNIVGGALAVLVLLFVEDWRMGLSMLIVLPLGIRCFMSMFSGYEEKFQRTVTATKTLNDTAVEYISGIEVIKAFGQSRTSYAKFVSAAKEGADCFIDWMRGASSARWPAWRYSLYTSRHLTGGLPSLYAWHSVGRDVPAVIVLSFGVMQPLITAFSYTDDIAQVKTIVDEVAEVLSGEDMQRPERAEKLPADNAVELKDVRFAYHDKEVLHGIDLHIAPGTVNALWALPAAESPPSPGSSPPCGM